MATGDELTQILGIVTNINNFKEEIAKLDLNPRARTYYDSQVYPLLNVLNDLSNGSYNFANSTSNLAEILRLSKIKDVKNFVVDINNESEDVFEALEHKIDVLIEISKKT